MATRPCPRCGQPVTVMRIPADWSAETAEAWRRLEERFVCDACDALIIAYAVAEDPSLLEDYPHLNERLDRG